MTPPEFVSMSAADLELCARLGLVERNGNGRGGSWRLTAAGIALAGPRKGPTVMERARQAFDNRHNVSRDESYKRMVQQMTVHISTIWHERGTK